MLDVRAVAYYILDKLGPVSSWKFQKLIYYCQAWSLAWEERPLFRARIEAWQNGPVCPDLYNDHKGLFTVDKSMFADYADDVIDKDDMETMDAVIRDYGDEKGWFLRELTHSEDPWILARNGLPEGVPSNAEITKESMRDYYSSL